MRTRLKRQQLEGQIDVLREQIHSVETSRKNQLEQPGDASRRI